MDYKPNHLSRLYWTMNVANSEATKDITVIIVFKDGPAVSLKHARRGTLK